MKRTTSSILSLKSEPEQIANGKYCGPEDHIKCGPIGDFATQTDSDNLLKVQIPPIPCNVQCPMFVMH